MKLNKKNSYPIYCINDEIYFTGISEAEKYYNLRRGNLRVYLHKNNSKYINVNINGEIKKYNFIILDYYKNYKSIICLENYKVYKKNINCIKRIKYSTIYNTY